MRLALLLLREGPGIESIGRGGDAGQDGEDKESRWGALHGRCLRVSSDLGWHHRRPSSMGQHVPTGVAPAWCLRGFARACEFMGCPENAAWACGERKRAVGWWAR